MIMIIILVVVITSWFSGAPFLNARKVRALSFGFESSQKRYSRFSLHASGKVCFSVMRGDESFSTSPSSNAGVPFASPFYSSAEPNAMAESSTKENSASESNRNSTMSRETVAKTGFVSGVDRWTSLRKGPRRCSLTFWSFVDECLRTLNKDDRRFHIESFPEVFPLTVTFTSESPVTLGSGDRGKLLRDTSIGLSDVTFLLARNFEEFELTILSMDLQSSEQTELLTPSWAFEELEDILPTLRRESLQRKEYAGAFATLAKCDHNGDSDGNAAAEAGIKVLYRHFERISCDPWASSSRVACLLFHKLSFNEPNARAPIDSVLTELPRKFISIGPEIDLRVKGKKVPLDFYQRRIAEMTRFDAAIDSSGGTWRPWSTSYDTSDLCATETLVHLFVGFDIMRCKSVASRTSWLYMLFVGEMGLLSGVQINQTQLSQGCGLTTLVFAPGAPTVRDRSELYYVIDKNRNGDTFLTALGDLVQAVGAGFFMHHRDQSQHSTSCLVNRILRVQRQAVEDHVSTNDILPRSSLNTFTGWKYESKATAFADGYIAEIGLDTLLQLPPSTFPPPSFESSFRDEPSGKSSEDTKRKRERSLEGQLQSNPGPEAAAASRIYEESVSRTFGQSRNDAERIDSDRVTWPTQELNVFQDMGVQHLGRGIGFEPPLPNASGGLSCSNGIDGLSIADRRLKWYESAFRREQERCRTLQAQVQHLTAMKEDLENRLRSTHNHEELEQCKRENSGLRQQVSVLMRREEGYKWSLQRATEARNGLVAWNAQATHTLNPYQSETQYRHSYAVSRHMFDR
jgi:hypothetical protein